MKLRKILIGMFLVLVAGLVLSGILFLAANHKSELASSNISDTPIDLIVIEKSQHRLALFSRARMIRDYQVALGRNPGQKEQRGDGKTPEGKYKITEKNPNSKFHIALLLSYPNDEDLKRAHELGVDPGSDIEIHGLQNGLDWVGSIHKYVDWTDGCIGVTDEEIEEISSLVKVGTPVVIYP